MYSSSQQVEDYLERYPMQTFHDNSRPGVIDLTPYMQKHFEDRQQLMDQMHFADLEEYEAYWNRTLKYYEQCHI